MVMRKLPLSSGVGSFMSTPWLRMQRAKATIRSSADCVLVGVDELFELSPWPTEATPGESPGEPPQALAVTASAHASTAAPPVRLCMVVGPPVVDGISPGSHQAHLGSLREDAGRFL